MATTRRARIGRVLLRSLMITVGAVAVTATIGFLLGGWAGAKGASMWGLVAGSGPRE